MALTKQEMLAQLEQAMRLIVDVLRSALANEHPAIHQDLVEVGWYKTEEVQPKENQRVIVQTDLGAQYFMTYPFSATKYPLWWVIPQAVTNH